MNNPNLTKAKLTSIEFRWFIVRLFFETKYNKSFFNYIKESALNGHDISLILLTILKYHDNQKYIRSKIYNILKNNKDLYDKILKDISYINRTPTWFEEYDLHCDEPSYNSSWEDIINNKEKIHFSILDLYSILSTHHESISDWTDITKIIIHSNQTKQFIDSLKNIIVNSIKTSDNKNTSAGGFAKSKKYNEYFTLRIKNLKQELKTPKIKETFKDKLKKEKLYYLVEIDFNYCKQANISVKPYSKFSTFKDFKNNANDITNSHQARLIAQNLAKYL